MKIRTTAGRGVAAAALAVLLAVTTAQWAAPAATLPAAARSADAVTSSVALPGVGGSEPTPPPTMSDYPESDYVAEAATLPDALVDALAETGVTTTEYLAQADAAVDATAVVDSLTAQGEAVLGSRLEGTDLVVNVASADQVAAVEAVGATAEIGEPANLDLTGIDIQPAQDLSGGEPYFFMRGTSGFTCSLGFNGYQVSTGAPRFATAGHCEASDYGQQYSWLSASSAGGGLSFPSNPSPNIGTPVSGSFQFNGGYDVGLVNVNTANPRAWTPKPQVTTWQGGAGAPTTFVPVTDQIAPVVGATACKSGATTGWTCGTIVDVANANVSGNTVLSIVTDACVKPGDSGGSLLVGTAAAGITSWLGTASPGAPDPCAVEHYSGFSLLVSPFADEATAAKKYAGTWEPAVSVSVPTIVSPAPAAVIPPGSSLTGTLTNGDVRHVVDIFFDGSSSPVTASVNSGGNWSADLSALSPGTHTYQVRGRWGTWSKSPLSATGSFTITGSTISGHVSGTGVANAAGICVDAIESAAKRGTATTDASGNYTISNLPGGSYTLHFVDCPAGGSIFEDRWWSNSDSQAAANAFTVGSAVDVVGKDATLILAGPFLDVRNSHPFATQIAWMSTASISTGYTVTGGKEYRPAEDVSRGAMAAFLYRLAGSPAFTPPVTPTFVDVPTSHPFFAAIEWMYAQEITTGSSGAGGLSYNPGAPVSREAMSAFLYRLYLRQGNADDFVPPDTASFTDKAVGAPFYKFVEWMKARGISTGYNDGGGLFSFHPGQAVSRAAMAAFLGRYDALP